MKTFCEILPKSKYSSRNALAKYEVKQQRFRHIEVITTANIVSYAILPVTPFADQLHKREVDPNLQKIAPVVRRIH